MPNKRFGDFPAPPPAAEGSNSAWRLAEEKEEERGGEDVIREDVMR